MVPRACGCVKPSVKEEGKLPRGTKEAMGKGNWEEGGEGTGRWREGRGVENIIACSTRVKCANVLCGTVLCTVNIHIAMSLTIIFNHLGMCIIEVLILILINF